MIFHVLINPNVFDIVDPKKILIVEDDLALLETLQGILEFHGYHCLGCHQADQIIREIERFRPELILLDYLLPEWNGGEICAAIRGLEGFEHTPIIIMSAYSKILLSLSDYGCNLILEKPFDISELLGSVKSLLESRPEDSGLFKKIRIAWSKKK
jgi:two-component system response regulator VicR